MKNVSLTGTVFVFVHGAWHSSGQWAATQRALAGLGAASVAVDLPGHGFDAPLPTGYLLPGQPGLLTEKSRLAPLTMDDCAEAVLTVLRQVRHHRTVVLVAHSAGGGPASLAAEWAPELVDRDRLPVRVRPGRAAAVLRLPGLTRERHRAGPEPEPRRPRGPGRRTDQSALTGSRLPRRTAGNPLPRHPAGPL
ncbi:MULTISPECIES: alpha/beta fold hydrolase [unclassified Kitasatospora]|uniref:alpha/beta hydrolase n=1 Tax=unclassified Kitasatospora TaxID=2633591 RepID=UPI0033DA37CA